MIRGGCRHPSAFPDVNRAIVRQVSTWYGFASELMSIRTSYLEWSRANLRRGMAIALLAIAFVDLGTMLPCCAEEIGLPGSAISSPTRVRAVGGNEHKHVRVGVPSSDEKSTGDPADALDGCFCCALGMPTATSAAEDLGLPEPAIDRGGITLPTSSPSSPYRPPRFA